MNRSEHQRLKESLQALRKGFLAVIGFSFAINLLMLSSPLYMLHPLLGWVSVAGAAILFLIAILSELTTRKPHKPI